MNPLFIRASLEKTTSVQSLGTARRLAVSLTRPPAIAFLLVVALFGVIYYPTADKLARFWAANDTYHYAFLIPFISAALVWLRRNELRPDHTVGGVVGGTAISLIGLVALLAGRVSGTNLIEAISLVVSLSGLTLLLLGPQTFRLLLFPLAYLVAVVPFWDLLTARLHPFFQLYSATVGVAALRLAGIPVLQNGVFIELPGITLEVAEACSGINYLIAVLCVGIPLASLFVKRWSKRLLIVLAAVLIAILSNGFRVVMVCLFAYYGLRGPNGDIHGPYALFRSLLVSGIGFVALFALIGRFADEDGATWNRPLSEPRRPGAARVAPVALAVALVLLGSVALFGRVHRVMEVPLTASPRVFPATIAGWTYRANPSFTGDLDGLSFDDKLSRNYASENGGELNLFVGYFRRQEQGRELTGQATRALLAGPPGGVETVLLDAGTPVNEFMIDRGGSAFHVTYFYNLNGRIVARGYEEKVYSAWSSLVHARNAGSLTVVKSAVQKGESIAIARGRIREFLLDFLAAWKNYTVAY